MRLVAPAIGILGLVACSTPAMDGRNYAWSPRPALGAMQTRNYKVTWLAGQRLRVENARGAVIAEAATLEDLARIDPFLETVCTHASASAKIDASVARLDLGHGRSGSR